MISSKLRIAASIAVFVVACGPSGNNISKQTNNGGSNNGGTNNGGSNNGGSNNGGSDCGLDADCADGEACEQQACVAVCGSTDDCAAGEVCDEGLTTAHYVCQPSTNNGTGCALDSDCGPDEGCEAESCVPTCQSNADCDEGEYCGEGINTLLPICLVGAANNGVDQEYVVLLTDVTSGGEGCDGADPGSDIFGIALEAIDGGVIGWGTVVWDDVVLDGNDYTDVNVIDGTPPGNGIECPDDFGADAVVSLGCGGSIAIEFFDDGGDPVLRDPSAVHTVRVLEWGAQCGGTVDDEYRAFGCTNPEAARNGTFDSCTVSFGGAGSGETAYEVEYY